MSCLHQLKQNNHQWKYQLFHCTVDQVQAYWLMNRMNQLININNIKLLFPIHSSSNKQYFASYLSRTFFKKCLISSESCAVCSSLEGNVLASYWTFAFLGLGLWDRSYMFLPWDSLIDKKGSKQLAKISNSDQN